MKNTETEYKHKIPTKLHKLAKWRPAQISLSGESITWVAVNAAETAVPGLLLQLIRTNTIRDRRSHKSLNLQIMHEKTGARVPCLVVWPATPEGLEAAQAAVAELAAFGDWTRGFGPGKKSDLIDWSRKFAYPSADSVSQKSS